jgi:hypothetical protein
MFMRADALAVDFINCHLVPEIMTAMNDCCHCNVHINQRVANNASVLVNKAHCAIVCFLFSGLFSLNVRH